MKKSSRNTKTQKDNLIDLFDQAVDCWENIVAVTELVQTSAETKFQTPRTFVRACEIISSEADKIHELLEKIREQSIKPAE